MPDPRRLSLVGLLRPDLCEAVVDDLEVTAVCLSACGQELLLVALDVLCMQGPEVDELRAAVSASTGVSQEAVVLASSHTHAAPAPTLTVTERLAGGAAWARQRDWVADLRSVIVEVAKDAIDDLRPARIRRAQHGDVGATLNRRERDTSGQAIAVGWNPDGEVDPALSVAQLHQLDGEVIATIVNFGCHPLCAPIDASFACSDFVGPLRALIRDTVGGEVLFLQGACGDVMPRIAFDQRDRERKRLGRRLAISAMAALEAQDPLQEIGYRVDVPYVVPTRAVRWRPLASRSPALHYRFASVECAFALRGAGGDGNPTSRPAAIMRQSAGTKQPRSVRGVTSGALIEYAEAELGAVRLGEVTILFAPFELFARTAIRLRRIVKGPVMIAGCCNDMLGYLPPREEIAAGGYEVDDAPKFYGTIGPVLEHAERQICNALAELAEAVSSAGTSDPVEAAEETCSGT